MEMKNVEKMLLRELRILNQEIDEKIIKGLSYTREAKRHKFIVSSLNSIKRSRVSWFARSFSLV